MDYYDYALVWICPSVLIRDRLLLIMPHCQSQKSIFFAAGMDWYIYALNFVCSVLIRDRLEFSMPHYCAEKGSYLFPAVRFLWQFVKGLNVCKVLRSCPEASLSFCYVSLFRVRFVLLTPNTIPQISRSPSSIRLGAHKWIEFVCIMAFFLFYFIFGGLLIWVSSVQYSVPSWKHFISFTSSCSGTPSQHIPFLACPLVLHYSSLL